jgi:hypothetical protein
VLVVLNLIETELSVECRESWLVIQEPPADFFPWIYDGHEPYSRVYSPFCERINRYHPSHGALPWHLEMSYDELKALPPPKKYRTLSWVTSNRQELPGHRARLDFLAKLQQSRVELDLFGRGFKPIADKYEGLGPYRYSLAVENHAAPHHWTEKVADCFLSWTMPIYYGCANLADYFPKESFIQIDLEDPNVIARIYDAVNSEMYLKQQDAIAEARRLVLDKYQLFPFIAQKLEDGSLDAISMTKHKFHPYKESLRSKVNQRLRRLCA